MTVVGDPQAIDTGVSADETVRSGSAVEGDSRARPRPGLPIVAVAFSLLALVSTFSNSTGRWIADARLEYSTNPGGFLFDHQYLWDAHRGVGNTSTFYSPVMAAFQAAAAGLGAEPWVVERLVHSLLLTTAAVTMVALVRVVAGPVGLLHIAAGFIYGFNPYTSQFLLPSGLFLSYALSPLLLLAFLSGVRSRANSWRMAALFALSIFCVGALNPASIIYAAAPLLIAALYVLLVDRSASWRDVLSWTLRAGVLSLGTAMAAVVVLWFQLGDVALNLATTERPTIVSSRSSYTESWRGLGMWVSYFHDGSGQIRPEIASYFDSGWIILATFAAPFAAALTLATSHWRPRLFFSALVGVGVVLMVGLWPNTAPSPIGRVLSFGFDNVDLFRGFRTTYKAGAMMLIGVAVLAATAIANGLRGSSVTGSAVARVKQFGAALLIVAVVAAGAPFWTGDLYTEADGFDAIPEYWDDALSWLNEQPDAARVMVAPGVVRARYRWGYVNDNLFHGLLDKSFVSHQSIPPPGTPYSADVIRRLDDFIASAQFEPGALAPILRRLGVRWLVLQNDLDWQRLGINRPATLDAVRADPDLRVVETFGEVGENTSAPGDASAAALGETELPPIEVYEVVDAVGPVRFEAGRPTLLAGGGDAWPQLARGGFLDEGPIVYSSTESDAELERVLGGDANVVISDGARRRLLQTTTSRVEEVAHAGSH